VSGWPLFFAWGIVIERIEPAIWRAPLPLAA
jgi:hypothetical protein